ncbi:hypothetical protein FACS18949_13360 [Clostridia bacterium]|nr:hypothetical protein FACS189425_06920 [Clostridia bacterium]GHV35421.1 hypothetical protein FACS18949_13360 [Clostridia bacterium]
MKPIVGIELDDSNHNTEKAIQRDIFVEKVYKDANLPLIQIKTQRNYTEAKITKELTPYLNITASEVKTPAICPRCNIPMVKRTPRSGGDKFYGCTNYPNCRETKNI